jgi:hypothetical protein
MTRKTRREFLKGLAATAVGGPFVLRTVARIPLPELPLARRSKNATPP